MAFRYARDSDDPRAGLVEVDGDILRDDKPRSVLFHDGRRSQWLPRSKIIIQRGDGGRASVCMPAWLAREKGYV